MEKISDIAKMKMYGVFYKKALVKKFVKKSDAVSYSDRCCSYGLNTKIITQEV